MLIQNTVGFPLSRQASGAIANQPGGVFGELLNSKLLPDYYSLVKSGMVFGLAVAAANPSAFVGGAAGTPLIGLYNPMTSGKDIVLLEVALGIRTTGTAAVATDTNHWGVVQGATSPTGTQTQPRNLYNLNAGGSSVYAMANTANTGALASSLLRPAISIGLTAATAVTNVQRLVDELKGQIVIPPGGYYAFGASVATTAASMDVAAIWAEIPA